MTDNFYRLIFFASGLALSVKPLTLKKTRKDAVRARFRLGVLAYHPSLLPAHRGRDATRWAIHMLERVTGGTVYWMDDGVDTCPLEAQDFCHILQLHDEDSNLS